MGNIISPNQWLQEQMNKYIYDPTGFVNFNYPWGQPGSKLEKHIGPDTWQVDLMDHIGYELKQRVAGLKEGPIQIIRASGHGIGKTAQMAWLIDWFHNTRPHPQIVTTSNTLTQLTTKTWRELAVWHQLSLTKEWNKWTATKFARIGQESNWYASAIPWSKERSEAFAGTHEDHVMILMDEGSLIDEMIFQVTEGALTSGECIWVVFGNPTRNSGPFYEAFHKRRHRWNVGHIDSRTSRMIKEFGGMKKVNEWLQDWGEDSDFFKVRVRGLFPDQSSMQFIASILADSAKERTLQRDISAGAPKTMGVDVARYGDDQSVLLKRQGLHVLPLMKWRESGPNWVHTFARIIQQEALEWKADAIFIDDIGVGGGVVDNLRAWGVKGVYRVIANERATANDKFADLRMEMWWRCREWLVDADLPQVDWHGREETELYDDLTGPEYGYDGKGLWRLESKDDMKKRQLASPDCADALVHTFAHRIQTIEEKHADIQVKMVQAYREKERQAAYQGTQRGGGKFQWQHKR